MKKTDLSYLLKMTDKNNELIMEIIEIFVTQVEEIWNEMQDYYNKGDYNSLGMIAHKAKTSVSIMGMNSLSKKLKDLELFCRDNKNQELYQDIINEFKTDCLQAIEELKDYKQNHLM